MGRHHRRKSRSRSNSYSDRRRRKEKRKSKWSDKPPSDYKPQQVDTHQQRYQQQNQNSMHDNAITIVQNNQMQNNPTKIVQQTQYSDRQLDPTQIQNFLKQAQASSQSNQGIGGVGYAQLGVNINDPSKIKRKVYMPKNSNFNYSGLIIGPKGANQKRLEEETGCKILVRGKGSQKEGSLPQPDDDEEQHVLIMGDFESQVNDAANRVERILFAEEDIRNNIRQEQLKVVASLKNVEALGATSSVDLSLTTPYGPPSNDAYIIPIPNDCVGLVIGKSGENIKHIQEQSGARKVQVAADSAQQSDTRNVFVEGDPASIEMVKELLENIIATQQKIKFAKTGQSQGMSNKHELVVPNSLVGLVIGRKGETIKGIIQKSGAYINIPQECDPQHPNDRVLMICGNQGSVDIAIQEIQQIVDMGMQNQMNKEAQLTGMRLPMQQQPYEQQMPAMPAYQPQQMQQQQMPQQMMPPQQPQEAQPPMPPQNPNYMSSSQQIEQASLLYLQQLISSQQNTVTETIVENDNYY